VYSVGVVLYELFSQRRMWKNFDVAYIISGGQSDACIEMITQQWMKIDDQLASLLLELVLKCTDYDCDKRPTMREIHGKLQGIGSNKITK
jgi:hypothetical protein